MAGSRKTQGLIDSCRAAGLNERILILTYTRNNQREISHRLAQLPGDHGHIEVKGWFSFLLQDFIYPFLPLKFPGVQVEGFDFDSPPRRGASKGSIDRYVNGHQQILRAHLPELAVLINEAGGRVCLNRLEKIYDRIMIDEVQDLCGYDLEILELLIKSSIYVDMVGDIRQAILATNEREKKNERFKHMNILKWFQEQQRKGLLSIEHRNVTWRCAPGIAAFADKLFSPKWGFPPTESLNVTRTDHDGVFLIPPDHVEEYYERYRPLLLRHSKRSGRSFDHLGYLNFGQAKGLQRRRVLIYPTDPIKRMLIDGKMLTDIQAAHLYVAVTRAEQSVGFILSPPKDAKYPIWTPSRGLVQPCRR